MYYHTVTQHLHNAFNSLLQSSVKTFKIIYEFSACWKVNVSTAKQREKRRPTSSICWEEQETETWNQTDRECCGLLYSSISCQGRDPASLHLWCVSFSSDRGEEEDKSLRGRSRAESPDTAITLSGSSASFSSLLCIWLLKLWWPQQLSAVSSLSAGQTPSVMEEQCDLQMEHGHWWKPLPFLSVSVGILLHCLSLPYMKSRSEVLVQRLSEPPDPSLLIQPPVCRMWPFTLHEY